MASSMEQNNWSFNKSDHHPPVVRRIIELQNAETCLDSRQNGNCPSLSLGQLSFIIKKGKAISIYNELLILFDIYLKQDMSSSCRQKDYMTAAHVYGNALRTLSLELKTSLKNELSTVSHPSLGPEWTDYVTATLAPRRKASIELVEVKKYEMQLQKLYFSLISSIASNSELSLSTNCKASPRTQRKEIWLNENRAWEEKEVQFDILFDSIIRSRKMIAAHCGAEDYSEFVNRRQKADILTDSFANNVITPCRAILHKVHSQRKTKLGVKRLRPYDLTTRNIRGFTELDEWTKKTRTLIGCIHPSLPALFNSILDEGLHDLQLRKGKSAESCCHQLPHSKKAFVFLSLIGGRRDIMAGIHELGHAIHINLSFRKFHRFFNYKVNPATSEFFALTLELLSLEHLGIYYPDNASSSWAVKKHLEGILNVFLTCETVSTFEKAIYSTFLTASERKILFTETLSRNLGQTDYQGYEKHLGLWSYRIPLLVSAPGYFANYAHTQLAALFFYDSIRKGIFSIEDYLRLMEEKGNASPTETYREIGFVTDGKNISNILESLAERLLRP
ncbi:hypothetical protein GKC30_14425 [Pseudodesulfovibrio sp. F-1]|uniref:Peptidase M3A/M3B catalytic domain-containing protein n=2 Tax=Pseudodesulfovibrio alkaliphilus TaxID=2661613 RepID=A0A7K1KRV6_9BACT|nr:hypothetical protein [Pseudodesulfovibrio alkaliphilus]